ncbi:MAG: ribose 5-phosphate isomerase B [Candidatus Cloacimonetes bacterium]|nr:ribose 5-phosphate isomerase B [Candidatus Cloacimonadota bacterium]
MANKTLKTKPLRIAIASDHAAFHMKESLKSHLKNYITHDFGTDSSESMDYPDTGFAAAEAVASGEYNYGIILCGSGIGMSIVANKVKGIRAALCHCTDYARLARMHNDANVLVMPGRFISDYLAQEIITIFLNTHFEGGRHQKRIEKITDYENTKK